MAAEGASSTAGSLGIELLDVAGSVPLPGGVESRPALRAFRLRLSGSTVAKLLARFAPEALARAGVAGRIVETRLEEGSVLVVAELRKLVTVTLSADLALSAAGEGRIRVEATRIKAGGWLPLDPVVEVVLGAVRDRPGVRQVGPRAVELDVQRWLTTPPLAIGLPFRWATGISDVRTTPEFLEVVCTKR